MVVNIDSTTGITIFNERVCPDCDEEETLTDTGCDSPTGCLGYSCIDCGWGCDLDVLDEDDEGSCAWHIANEDPEERAEREDADRSMLGLPSLRARAESRTGAPEASDG